VMANLSTCVDKPINEGQARELARLEPADQRVVAQVIDFEKATVKDVREAIVEYRASTVEPATKPQTPRSKSNLVTLAAWKQMSAAGRTSALSIRRDHAHFNAQ